METINNENCIPVSNRSKQIRSKIFAEKYEYSINNIQTHFSLSIPSEGSQNFNTNLGEVKWCLNFHFIVGKSTSLEGSVQVDSLQWSLPIEIVNIDYPDILQHHQYTYFHLDT